MFLLLFIALTAATFEQICFDGKMDLDISFDEEVTIDVWDTFKQLHKDTTQEHQITLEGIGAITAVIYADQDQIITNKTLCYRGPNSPELNLMCARYLEQINSSDILIGILAICLLVSLIGCCFVGYFCRRSTTQHH